MLSLLGERSTALRLSGVAAVFFLGFIAFASGVETTEMENLKGQNILAWMYYCAALFVLGGLDLGTPDGGPVFAQAALWIAFFLAPAITATAIIDAIVRLIRSGQPKRQPLSNHAVLIGNSKLARTYILAIQNVDPDKQLLHLVDADQNTDSVDYYSPGGTEVLHGSVDEPEVLQAAQLENAGGIIVITDDDLLNLELAWAIKDRAPRVPLAVHVTELRLLRPVTQMLREEKISNEGSQPLVFNTHRIAALQLYENMLLPHFTETGYKDVVILVGFGGFAQTILELLKAMATDELEHVFIVDQSASLHLREFEADVSLAGLSHSAIDGPLEDPYTWDKVDDAVASMTADPVYLLASNDEFTNLRTAMLVRSRASGNRIFVQCFRNTKFAKTLAKQRNFELFVYEEVVLHALEDHYQSLITL